MDLSGLSMNPYSGPGLGGISSPSSPGRATSALSTSGFQTGSQFSGSVSCVLRMSQCLTLLLQSYYTNNREMKLIIV